ncbi:hypothetical protein [Prevotella intermedia]|uniref:hypothetical protein n=1 Tax=Prevotella intermedia TaxID=28131 RepID=UPI00397BAF72
MEWIKADDPIEEVELFKSSKDIAKDIIKEMNSKWESFFLGGEDKEDKEDKIVKEGLRTTKLFELLTTLGDGKGYKVYSHSLSKKFIDDSKENNNGVTKFVNREWLFDLCWYKEDETLKYGLKSLDLAVESEWTNKRKEDKEDPYGGIKYDFQKLLVANMGLCLMVFEVTKEGREELSKYFEKVYDIYEGNKTEILFIAFSRKEKTFYYSYLPKKQKDV